MATERSAAGDVGRWFGPLATPAVNALFDHLAHRIDPKSDLVFASTFELLVAVVLSAQATDRSVNAATAKLFPVANTPAALAALGAEGILPFIRTVGLAPTKSRNVARLSQLLIERHGGQVPRDRESLEALPGVGRKTANVVLNVAFGEPTIAVDTHVHRVANRTGLAKTTTPEQTERVLLVRVPPRHLLHAHHYLILHGRYTCLARKPECWRCPLLKLCRFSAKTPRPPTADPVG